MAFSVSGSVALVTGSNRGIGRALVESLLKNGASKVYAGARKLETLGELTQADGDRVAGIELDITESSQVEAAAKAAADVNLLINNAGVAGQAGVAVTDPNNQAIGRREMEVNLFGTLAVSQAFAPILASNGDPLITYDWDFGDATTSTAEHPVHSYNTPGDYVVSMTMNIYEYILTDVTVATVGTGWCGDVES